MNPMSAQHSPVTLPDTEIRLLTSSIVNDTYRLFIALPANYANSQRSYPVLYATDGNTLFPLLWVVSEALSAGWEVPRLIIVGIGYDSDRFRKLGRFRERDLFPTNVSSAKRVRKQRPTPGQGSAFLRFIRQELQPFVNTNYRTDPDDSTYAGFSHGGLFGLYVLFHHPETFNRYVIGSPSIYHDNRVTLTYESNYAANHSDLPARVFLSVGAREELDDPLIKPSFHFVTNVKTLAKTLEERRYPGLQLTTRVFDGETHGSVIPMTFSRGLQAVFG